eukprot:Gregarina_sp_Poly_1__681@NODE_1162_length_4890_cov_49_798673_g797_i0_p2_GENE_NODE_1162_length_4890_cov_49_798673_g797_i0NODE_1162_length_4890_cov_49_798673_g797_i0_p2_ORF_typecomplete_len530_score98_35DEAD/PF00270_29/3_3e51DEAD/PF00270_29/21Helicase_C/PF00271_31/1_5e03Helicase_C/PF00271_31/1_7e03Helicase_C/PF00271_31/9_6e30ERCC3_RAD25_C/PF16203_5/8_7e13ResIII/PF04851_15/3_3e10SNF2_N/PF00176_23/0_0047Flavi_DEAD/PF07652_14/0_013AAA_19/PF13245_6/1_2e03AAA_19/PF13245_6/0_15CMS1/PF14617_6/8_2e03CMS1/
MKKRRSGDTTTALSKRLKLTENADTTADKILASDQPPQPDASSRTTTNPSSEQANDSDIDLGSHRNSNPLGESEEEYVTSADSESEDAESVNADEAKAKGVVKSFVDLGLAPELVQICDQLKWQAPTPIQIAAIPAVLAGRDVIGLAETGSGKTGAFVLPILHSMLTKSAHPMYAAVVSPTRELCSQIAGQFDVFGRGLLLKVVTLVGGLSTVEQAKALARLPHVVVATPGRLIDHLENTKGFSLSDLEFFVMDEADRLLTLDFEEELKKIIRHCPARRQTLLFSATMSSRVSKLEKLSLQKPVKVGVSEKTDTAPNLKQYMVLVPLNDKFAYLAAWLRKFEGYRTIVFCNTCKMAVVMAAFLRRLNFSVAALTGDMKQAIRLGALNRFKRRDCKVLLTTEVGSRGLDLPEVRFVVNFDVPMTYKDYIHRVGRTARAGQSGQSFTLVTQYEAERFLTIERKIGVRCEKWDEIGAEIYRNYDLPSLRKSAEQEFEEAKKKKIFKKKKN